MMRDAGDGIEQSLLVEGLPNQWARDARRRCAHRHVVSCGDEDDGQRPAFVAELLFELQAAETRQRNVEDRAVGVAAVCEVRLSRLEQVNLVPVRAKQTSDRPTNMQVVVDKNENQP